MMSEPSTFEFKMAIEKLKRYKLAGTDQIPPNVIQLIKSIIIIKSRRTRWAGHVVHMRERTVA